MDVPFGEWLPDQGSIVANNVLTQCINWIPVATGYRAIPADRDGGYAGVTEAVQGAFRGRTQSGTEFVVVGTATKLFLATTTAFADVSKGGGYSISTNVRWEFVVYGNRVIAVAPNVAPQTFLIGTDTLFSDLSADASFAEVICVSDEFIIIGNLEGRGVNAGAIGIDEAALHWSAIGVPASWPLIGSAAALNVQSDYQSLLGDGGPITAIVPAAEYIAVMRERQVWRMDYTGDAKIFQFRKIDDHRGCICPGAAIALGNFVYYPSEDGFMVFDGANVRPIGHEKIDRTWRALTDRAQYGRVSVAHDPTNSVVLWLFPPSDVFIYQYEIDRWAFMAKTMEWLMTSIPLTASLDSAPFVGANMDDVTPPVDLTVSPATGVGLLLLDTLRAATSEVLSAFVAPGVGSSEHTLVTFDDPAQTLQGVIEAGDFEMPNGGRGRVRYLRPVLDAPEEGTSGVVTAFVSGRNNSSEVLAYKPAKTLTKTGVLPCRVTGRYLRAVFVVNGNVGVFQGFDPRFEQMGIR